MERYLKRYYGTDAVLYYKGLRISGYSVGRAHRAVLARYTR